MRPPKWEGSDVMCDENKMNGQQKMIEELQNRINVLQGENEALRRECIDFRFREEKGLQRQKIFETIFENSPLAIMYTDEHGTITTCNGNAVKVFGAAAEKLIGFNFQSIKNDKMREAIAQALSGRTSRFEGEYLTVTGNRITHMNANFSPTLTKDGAVSGVIGIFEDISERVNVESSLRELKERFRLAFHTSPDAVNLNMMDGTYIDINEGFTELTGYAREEVIGRTSGDIEIWEIPADRERLINDLREKGFIKNLESRFRLKDGSSKIALMSANVILLDGEPHILSIAKDITDLREAERDRQHLQAKLHHAQKIESVGVLAGGIAHDFNNLLAAIQGNIDLSLHHIDPQNKAHSLLQAAEEATMRAKDLTQQLLTFAKGGEPLKKNVSLESVVRPAADFVLSGSKVRCEYDFSTGIYAVEADAGQISQVVQNMVINAHQAMHAGGIIEISAENFSPSARGNLPLSERDYVKLVIRDNGIGISDGQLDRIFDPYFTTKEQGSGLGLAVAYSIIRKHDGHISVKTSAGNGSTFSIYLPASREKVKGEERPIREKKAAGKGRILVMDDEELVRKVAKNMLEYLGCQVLTAEDGVEAIAVYCDAAKGGSPIDMVIMDLTIPGGMGGEEAVKELLRIDPQAKVVVVSGYANDPIMANYRQYGFSDAVSKPFQVDDFVQLLESLG